MSSTQSPTCVCGRRRWTAADCAAWDIAAGKLGDYGAISRTVCWWYSDATCRNKPMWASDRRIAEAREIFAKYVAEQVIL
jgi:hypothetical protein